MLSPLRIGTCLLQTDTVIPESVTVQKETFCDGWQEITNLSADDVDREVRKDRWNFMFMGGGIGGSSWGSWSGTAVRSAALRALGKAKAKKFNAFEITAIHARRFVGIPYVVVTGHSRHLQKGTTLQNIAERIHQAARLVPNLTSGKLASAAPVPAPVAK